MPAARRPDAPKFAEGRHHRRGRSVTFAGADRSTIAAVMSQSRWRAVFGLDERSLGAFRIGLGLLLLFDLANHAPWLGAFFTDRGLFPRSEVQVDLGGLWPPQVWSGDVAWQAALWGVGLVAAALFTAGCFARAAAAVSALVVLSFMQRNMAIVYAGDHLLYLSLLWSSFLPTDRRFSIASRRRSQQPPADPLVVSVGSAALVLQVVLLYAVTAVSKLQYPAWYGGHAVYAVLSKASLASHLGEWLRSFPRLLSVLSMAAPLAEGAIALLLATPLWKGRLRTAGVFVNALFQLGLWLCLQIGIFQALALVIGLPFLPASFWQRMGVGPGATVSSPAIEAPRGRLHRVGMLLRDALCGALLAVMVVQNALTLPRSPVRVPGRLGRWLSHPAVAQRWRMFANVHATPQGWWLAPGRLPDGRVIDLWTGQPLRLGRPAAFIDTIRSHHWERAWVTLYPPQNAGLRRYLAAYLCREWNSRHPADQYAREVQLIYMREVALDPAVVTPVEPQVLLSSRCPTRGN
jgi:hypothetical protein